MLKARLHARRGVSDLTSDSWQAHCRSAGYHGFIFDCDGTLVESADIHFHAFRMAAHEQGYTLDREWYLARTGLDRVSLFQEFGSGLNIDRAVERSISIFIENSPRVQLIEQTARLVRSLSGDFPLSVGTNAEAPVAVASLHAVGLLHHFEHIVSISDGFPPKPSPEIFLGAASLMQIPPNKTLVIEDSAQGVNAALAAGMSVIEIVSFDLREA
ncbi:HAD family phosphatase [Aliiroseovarius sp. KMU-50]|uniref:HAD family phosphatase n=1 Tax=Aliiroseovarius salicola TaxID=3009082 RepID=A0ABT4W4W1_9RHOB|nr:HAD family phosphatase [Aliiroseovarius sp. KMU-50]MDA5095562.1 HAD family phosphatase [Aliiroseovarius sp. KMU-50]